MAVPVVAESASIWLSLLVPVYNVEPYLLECIGSVLDQIGDGGVEVVLLDDASTDGSPMRCEQLRAIRPDIVRLLAHPLNRGVSAARNQLLDEARGDYVWFLDSDDILLPGAIAGLEAIVAAHRPDMVLCDYRAGSGGVEDGAAMASFDGVAGRLETDCEALVQGIFSARRLHLWSKICRRELWDGIRFPVGACFEDVATVPWVVLRTRSYYYAAAPWVFYRRRPGSIMARIARTRGAFDTRRHDDLALALRGFGEALETALPHAGVETRLAVSRFCAREYVKIGKRLLGARWRSGWGYLRGELRRYRRLAEADSPIGFDGVARHYLRRGKPVRWAALALMLLLTRSPAWVRLSRRRSVPG